VTQTSTVAGPRAQWPKRLPVLTEEQQRIRADFMAHWLEVLPRRYGLLEKFNHGYPLRSRAAGARTLELGAGLGAHLAFEDLTGPGEYVALEHQAPLAERLAAKYPRARVVTGDCQARQDFPDGHFDRVLAVHVLEHLPDLPRCLDEVRRLLRPGGLFAVVLPCEGGWAYALARRISARRIFEKRYKQSYDWFVACEHINLPHEILEELNARFETLHRSFFPLRLPVVNFNLVIGLTLRRPAEADVRS